MTDNKGIFIPDEEPQEIQPVSWKQRLNPFHKINPRNRSLSAASINNVRNMLDAEQLKDCAEAYANNGIVRSTVDKQVWFVQGPNTKFIIEPNNELIDGLTDEEVKDLEEDIKERYKELKLDTIRINKRVQLHDRLTKFLIHTYVFGQAYLEIVRNKPGIGEGTNKYSQYGEPLALKVLNPLRIEEKFVNVADYEFEGILYNYGTQVKGQSQQKKKRINSTELIGGWHDDANVFDNTYYSGMSPVWTVLSASQTMETILDENLPEFIKGNS